MKKFQDHPVARTINLAFNAGLALAVPGFSVHRSILGDKSSYESIPAGFSTERDAFASLDLATFETALRAALPLPEFGPFVRQDSGPILSTRPPLPNRPGEAWFFINGICADKRIAALNVIELENTFARPVTLLYNATSGFVVDLIECAAGKAYDKVTEAVAANLLPVVRAICDPETNRVVLLSHSQGTILAAVVLKWLDEVLTPGQLRQARAVQGPGMQKVSPERLAARELAGETAHAIPEAAREATRFAKEHLRPEHIVKLELYCFANCATSMSPIEVAEQPVRHHTPWIESYGNEYDLVARLGVLAPPHGIGSARIQGDRYRRERAWGHMLNAHYLSPMRHQLDGTASVPALVGFGENLRTTPRLFEYYKGNTPPPYP